MGFAEVLTIVLVVLKLLGISTVATWSWWWVFSPLIIVYGLALLLWLFGVSVLGTVGREMKRNDWRW